MNRRAFIKKLGLASIGLKFLPLMPTIVAEARFSIEKIMGIDSSHLASYSNILLEFETLQAYRKMKESAALDGIQLQTITGFKSFEYERAIFEHEYFTHLDKGYTALDAYHQISHYTPIPGASRYHWGTEIDVVDLNVNIPHGYVIDEEHYLEGGMFHQLTEWMENNAHLFGFYLPYTDDAYRKGFAHEPWHYSYQPTASRILKKINVHELTQEIHIQQIEGLDRIPNSFLPNYIEEYVFEVSKQLLFVPS